MRKRWGEKRFPRNKVPIKCSQTESFTNVNFVRRYDSIHFWSTAIFQILSWRRPFSFSLSFWNVNFSFPVIPSVKRFNLNRATERRRNFWYFCSKVFPKRRKKKKNLISFFDNPAFLFLLLKKLNFCRSCRTVIEFTKSS